MAVTISPPDAPAARLARFSPAERAAHWATAALMFVLFGTAAALYIPEVSTWVGRRNVVKDTHVWAGLLLPVPVLLGLAGRSLRRDLRRLARWDRLDVRWMRSLGRDRSAPPGKFNAGQKLFAVFISAAGVSMLLTGSVMKWYHPFPLAWRTGATFAHDWLALAMVVAVGGHIVKAVADPVALLSMFRGWVPAGWAARARPRWHAELAGHQEVASGLSDGGTGRAPIGRVAAAALAVLLAAGGTAVALSDRGGDGRSDDPGLVAMRWEQGVDRQDYEALYDLASTKFRAGADRSRFVTDMAARLLGWADEKGDIAEVSVTRVAGEEGPTATVTLGLRFPDGLQLEQQVLLEREDGWKVSEYPINSGGPRPVF